MNLQTLLTLVATEEGQIIMSYGQGGWLVFATVDGMHALSVNEDVEEATGQVLAQLKVVVE